MRYIALCSLVIFVGCTKPTLEPDFSRTWIGDPQNKNSWFYHVSKKITEQLKEKGLVQTKEKPDFFIYGMIGTWTDTEDYYYGLNKPVKIIDSNSQTEGVIFGKMKFDPYPRKATWYFIWSATESDKAKKYIQNYLMEFYKKNIHQK